MKNIKDWNWKQIGWRVLQALIILILNGATIFFMIANMIEVGGGEASWWEALTVKYVAKQLDLISIYHWYNDLLVFLFMILGFVATFFFIKLLWKNKQANKDRELENKKYELETKKLQAQEKAHKELSDRIEKIMRGK